MAKFENTQQIETLALDASAGSSASGLCPLALRVDPRVSPLAPATPGSAGLDLQAAIPEPLVLYPGQTQRIGTGWRVWLRNPGLCGLVFARSGLATKGLALRNSVGVLDSDYQGELQLTLWNSGEELLTILPLERVAQLVIVPTLRVALCEVSSFTSATVRGEGGFGSTGVSGSNASAEVKL